MSIRICVLLKNKGISSCRSKTHKFNRKSEDKLNKRTKSLLTSMCFYFYCSQRILSVISMSLHTSVKLNKAIPYGHSQAQLSKQALTYDLLYNPIPTQMRTNVSSSQIENQWHIRVGVSSKSNLFFFDLGCFVGISYRNMEEELQWQK